LQEVYSAPADKIDLIPHGIPDFPFVASESSKGKFGLSGKQVLLTFGLLSPNKGILFPCFAIYYLLIGEPAGS
jgi:hypothetical protein